jgi:predicted nucleic acid-binding protein
LADDEIAIAGVTLAEYRVGIELAGTVERAMDRTRTLAVMMPTMEVLAYTERTAVHHARLLAWARKSGRPRGGHDLIIASHAAETDRVIVSSDAKARFADLPGVLAIEP